MSAIEIVPVTPDRWPDLLTLFGPTGAYSNCWCTWWIWRSADWERRSPAQRRRELERRVMAGEEPGLLAYEGDDAIGWCAVAPRDRYARLDNPRARTYRRLDDRPSWVVTCFFIRRDRRRDGVATALLDAVGQFVAARGGSLIEGYPTEHPEHGPAAMYTGTVSMFRAAGFVEAARRGGRQLVGLELPRGAGAPRRGRPAGWRGAD
jgi:GNAT superfamily N-acetyltransferase